MSLTNLVKRMNVLAKTNVIERTVANSMLATTADRIFGQGKDASNTQIGTYSLGYQKTRIRKGYPNSTNVILQATTQMTNDWSVIQSGQGLGLGFKNQTNADKSGWVEDTYSKKIFAHTEQEKKVINALVQKTVSKIING